MRSVIQRERASALSPETGFDLRNVRSVESSWAHARHRELLRQLKNLSPNDDSEDARRAARTRLGHTLK